MRDPDAVVVGAGPAGLACAASMGALGLKVIVLEKASAVGSVWRRHYDRLHLHTDRGHSALPGMSMPRSYGRYPSRAHVVEYLENYARCFDLQPLFDCKVRSVKRDAAQWRAEADQISVSAPAAVMATGWADFPYRPAWPGMEKFRGEVIHSSEYRNADGYRGKSVLVVGLGNSGGEIALDLAEAKTIRGAGPESISPAVVMDSGLAPSTRRGRLKVRPGMTLSWFTSASPQTEAPQTGEGSGVLRRTPRSQQDAFSSKTL